MTTIDSIIEKFRLLWGEAPPGTLKARKGKDIESFIRTEFEAREKELVEAIKDMRKILWSDDVNQHNRNIERENVLNEVLTLIKNKP